MRFETGKKTQYVREGRAATNIFPTMEHDVIRRPMPSTECSPDFFSEEATTLEQAIADQANRAFRCLSRHARWAVVHEITHRRILH